MHRREAGKVQHEAESGEAEALKALHEALLAEVPDATARPLHTTTPPADYEDNDDLWSSENNLIPMVGGLTVDDEDVSFDATGSGAEEPADDQGAFWAWAVEKTVERAMREHWTGADMDAAYLQASLVSYESHESYPVIYGQFYVESDPEHYTSNCPWNDWTPPSESERLFREANRANVNRPLDGVSRRIRVRLIPVDCAGNGLITFVTVEVDGDGRSMLAFRRGSDVLASLFLRHVRLLREPANPRRITIIVQSRRGTDARMHLRFENEKRLRAFETLLGPDRYINA